MSTTERVELSDDAWTFLGVMDAPFLVQNVSAQAVVVLHLAEASPALDAAGVILRPLDLIEMAHEAVETPTFNLYARAVVGGGVLQVVKRTEMVA